MTICHEIKVRFSVRHLTITKICLCTKMTNRPFIKDMFTNVHINTYLTYEKNPEI